MTSRLPPFEVLRRLGNRPRVHPNGFIQLDFSDRERLHVWPEKPLPVLNQGIHIHDHIYPIESDVVLHQICNVHCQVEEHPQGEFFVYPVRAFQAMKQSTTLGFSDRRRYRIVSKTEHRYAAGDSYTFPAFEFHETTWEGLVATILRNGDFNPNDSARVLCPVGVVPNTFFDRYCIPDEVLWESIAEVCRRVG